MSTALRQPWTAERFLAWAGGQEGRWEFDGFQPVAMTGGTINHGMIMRNLHRALDMGLRGSGCQALGPDVGLATQGEGIRYPDALVTCSPQDGTARTVAGAVVVFEIVSPSSGGVDRIIKVREYAGVASLRYYVIVESTSVGLLVLHRHSGADAWTAETLTGADTLRLVSLNIDVPVSALYTDVAFPGV
jgi:Uma2 family endonuclease